jgi:hypothetical protein
MLAANRVGVVSSCGNPSKNSIPWFRWFRPNGGFLSHGGNPKIIQDMNDILELVFLSKAVTCLVLHYPRIVWVA